MNDTRVLDWRHCEFAGEPYVAAGSGLILRRCGLLATVPGTNWISVGKDDCDNCNGPRLLCRRGNAEEVKAEIRGIL